MRLRPAVPVLPSLLVASRLEPLLLAQPADSRPAALLDEIGAATLVLGTALGGGFLALPHATAPAGCLPATAVLTLCWLFLLLESLLVADLVIDATSEASPGGTPSFDSLGRAAFGDAGGAAVSATFLVLMLTTLVAQIAKASELAGGGAFGAAPRSLRCALLTAPLAVIARCAPPRLLGRLNGALASPRAVLSVPRPGPVSETRPSDIRLLGSVSSGADGRVRRLCREPLRPRLAGPHATSHTLASPGGEEPAASVVERAAASRCPAPQPAAPVDQLPPPPGSSPRGRASLAPTGPSPPPPRRRCSSCTCIARSCRPSSSS